MSDKVEEHNEEQKNSEEVKQDQNQENKPEEMEQKHESNPEQLQEGQSNENTKKEDNPQNEGSPQNEGTAHNEETHQNEANKENEKNEQKDEDDEEEEKEKEENDQKVEEKKISKGEKQLLNKMKAKEDKSIQEQIEQETKNIEQKKIDLRIMKERLAQKEKLYNELQGKPVNKTSEEKEKERRDKKKANKNHKFTDPIVRKKGREKQIQDDRERIAKEDIRKRSEFQKLTTDINELIISNKELKEQIIDLRKRKNEALKKKDEIARENEEKRANLEEMQKQNEVSKSQIMHKEYKNAVTEGIDQQKEFEAERDGLEEEYQKLREEYIRRERENKKENAKKRNMAALALSNKGMSSSTRDKDMEMELKKLADEEIMDRIPMLDICIEKWRVINNIKKTSIQIFQQNSTKIRDAFNKLTKYIGLDSFKELPIVYRKTEQQMSNINMYKEKLETQNDKLEYEKELISKQIEMLSGKKKIGNLKNSEFIEQKLKSIEIIENCAENFEKEINKRMKLIEKIKPETNKYLIKLGDTYLSDFICGKLNIDESSEYNEKTIDKYLSNVQDYFKLVQEWDKSTKENQGKENELDKLREEMKQKLGRFEQNRLLTTDLYQSMENDYKKGIKLDEIIRKSSQRIALDIQNPYSKSTVLTKTTKKKNLNISNATTEPGNYRYGNDSNITNNQQSSIIVGNNSMKKTNLKSAYTKLEEPA